MVENLVNWFKVAAKSRGYQIAPYEGNYAYLDPAKAKQL